MLKLEHNILLKNKTTIRLGGLAPYYCKIKSAQDLLAFTEQEQNLLPHKILGGGSNVIIADESLCKELPFGILDIDIAGEAECTPLQAKNLPNDCLPPLVQKKLSQNHRDFAHVCVGAGHKIPSLLQLCRKNGWSGLEGLVGIPCRVGGTAAMNAGAYQTETGDVLFAAELFHKDFGLVRLTRENIVSEYRKTHFFLNGKELQDYIITKAEFIFPEENPKEISERMEKNFQTKKNTQPVQAYTAGCVFKNPCNEKGEKISAGLLLDKAGMKGFKINGMQFSGIHASFMENTGSGTCRDALELLNTAKDNVLTLFNIQLEEEVKIWI